jgi:acyl-CoA hydrolase
MSGVKALYREKLRTAEEAIKVVRDGDTIVISVGEPPYLLETLSEHRREFHNVKTSQILAQVPFGYYDSETAEHICQRSLFFGSANRFGGQQGWMDFIPNSFGEIPELIRRGHIECDVFFSLVSPMDEHGYFSMSIGTDYGMAAVEKARDVVLEVNVNAPFAYGNNLVHISQVSAIVEDNRPLYEVQPPALRPIHEAMAHYVEELIPDGATIQVGFGPIPNALVTQLHHKRDLGVHTEILSDGVLTLVECGAVTNRKKNFMPNKIVATFALGSKKVFEFIHRNPEVEMHPVDFTNNPYIAGKNDNLICINSTLQVDFLGQCASESLGSVPYSGSGGQLDMVRAANVSKGGKAFLTVPSTAKNGTISRIVPCLAPGAHVTVGKNDVNYIVTEFGVAQLRGKSARQRTQALINIAHPDFRPELEAAARKINLM